MDPRCVYGCSVAGLRSTICFCGGERARVGEHGEHGVARGVSWEHKRREEGGERRKSFWYALNTMEGISKLRFFSMLLRFSLNGGVVGREGVSKSGGQSGSSEAGLTTLTGPGHDGESGGRSEEERGMVRGSASRDENRVAAYLDSKSN
jgi:hypothetical protein